MNETLQEGVKFFEQGQYDDALVYLEQLDPIGESDVAYYQALCYAKIDKKTEALKALDLVIAQDGNFLKILHARMIKAYILTALKSFSEAEKALYDMITEGVESPQVYSNYGYVLWASGRGKEAVAWLNKALLKDPENYNAMNSLAYILAEQGFLLDKALHLSRKALASNAESPLYLDTIGWVYHAMGQDKMAHYHLKRALELDPGNKVLQEHLLTVNYE